jgi:hypothetical protein
MKTVILSYLLLGCTLVWISCKPNAVKDKIATQNQIVWDTIYIETTDTVYLPFDSVEYQLSLAIRQRDSISNLLFIDRYKLEKIRFYLGITLRDRSQDKFLKGWIKRALE